MRRVIFHPQFKRDVAAAARYYERQQVGLGADFRDEVLQAVARADDFPLSGTLVDDTVRRQIVRRFPYHLLYQVDGEDVFILSVAHERSRPGSWRRRL